MVLNIFCLAQLSIKLPDDVRILPINLDPRSMPPNSTPPCAYCCLTAASRRPHRSVLTAALIPPLSLLLLTAALRPYLNWNLPLSTISISIPNYGIHNGALSLIMESIMRLFL